MDARSSGGDQVIPEAECDYSEECPAGEHDMGCYHEPLPATMFEFMGLPAERTTK
jgi:hypothetical protein